MRESENVVDEQQRVGTGCITEKLGHRQRRKGDTQTRSRRFVHLSEHHARLFDHIAAGVTDLSFLHFQPQVGAFARSFAHTGEHRITTVAASDTSDQFGQNHCLAQAGTTKQTRFTTTHKGSQQVDHLDAGLEQLRVGRKFS